jgi:hypothetical protein
MTNYTVLELSKNKVAAKPFTRFKKIAGKDDSVLPSEFPLI